MNGFRSGVVLSFSVILFSWIYSGLAQPTLLSSRDVEKTLCRLVNEYRVSQNLPPLISNDSIVKQARQHSQDMANGKSPFNHEGFDERMKMIAKDIPYHSAGENIAMVQGSQKIAENMLQQWLKSSAHRKNIEGDYDLTGIGVAQNADGKWFSTQIFLHSH